MLKIQPYPSPLTKSFYDLITYVKYIIHKNNNVMWHKMSC